MVTSGTSHSSLLTSYEQERRPIALSNTTLSLRNYEKSAAVARALGLDPSLAKMAVSAASAIPSATMGSLTATATAAMNLIPLSWRKVAVNAVLDTGLSTLSTLRKPHRWDPRMLLLRDIVQNGKSLPLIFPNEDIDFAYDKMTSVHTGTRASNDHHQHPDLKLKSIPTASTKKKSFDSPTKLRMGGRIPHCWFAILHTTPMTTTTATATTTVSKSKMISSIQLPGNIVPSHKPLPSLVPHHPDTPNESPTQTSPLTLSYLPSIIILVDIHHAEMWESVIDHLDNSSTKGSINHRKLFTVVRIQRQQPKRTTVLHDQKGKDVSLKKNSDDWDHTILQHILQNPCYQSNEHYHQSTDMTTTTLSSASNTVSSSPSTSSQPSPTLSSPFTVSKDTVFEDCTGRWTNICTQYRHNEHHRHTDNQPPTEINRNKDVKHRNGSLADHKEDELFCFPTVVLRPDGHVLRIFDTHNTKVIHRDLVVDQIVTILSDLHVVMK